MSSLNSDSLLKPSGFLCWIKWWKKFHSLYNIFFNFLILFILFIAIFWWENFFSSSFIIFPSRKIIISDLWGYGTNINKVEEEKLKVKKQMMKNFHIKIAKLFFNLNFKLPHDLLKIGWIEFLTSFYLVFICSRMTTFSHSQFWISREIKWLKINLTISSSSTRTKMTKTTGISIKSTSAIS